MRNEMANQQWKQIKCNHREERDVEALVALRDRLCCQVDAGIISVRNATEQFGVCLHKRRRSLIGFR
jgi:hypothetical protein